MESELSSKYISETCSKLDLISSQFALLYKWIFLEDFFGYFASTMETSAIPSYQQYSYSLVKNKTLDLDLLLFLSVF